MSDEALSSNERFVREQFPLLSALSSHNGNELQNEAMALISMAANLRRELAELETSLAIYKGRDEGKQLVINQLERHRDLLESNLKSFVAHAARGSAAQPWRCSVCNTMNPDDANHCRQCEFSRTVMRDGKSVPRTGPY